jgi:hypothetical protein
MGKRRIFAEKKEKWGDLLEEGEAKERMRLHCCRGQGRGENFP